MHSWQRPSTPGSVALKLAGLPQAIRPANLEPGNACDCYRSCPGQSAQPPGNKFSMMTALGWPQLLCTEVVAGLVVALALIPEARSFSISRATES